MLIGCAGALVAQDGQAITRAWKGTAGNNWSTPANWSPTGPPQNGDDLVFTNKVSNNIVNDLTGLTIRSMYFSLDFDLSGNALTLTSGITDATSGGVTLDISGLTLGSDIYLDAVNSLFSVYCPINLNGFTVTVSSYNNHWVDLDGVISNNGNIIVARGTNFIDSFNGNDFVGLLQVQGGTVWLDSFNSFAINSAVDVWAGATVLLGHDYQIDQGAYVLIEPSGQLLLNGHTNRFTDLEMRGGLLDSGAGGLIELMGRLQANATNQSPTVAGNVALEYDPFVNPPEFNVNGPWNPGLDITANLLSTGFSKTGLGLMRLAGVNTFVSGSTLWQGVVEADSNTAFGTGTVDMEGGAVSLRNVTITGVPLFVGWPNALQLDRRYGALLTALNTCVWTGPITLDTNLFAFVEGDLTLSGAITGPGGLSVWSGDAHLTGTAGNTFTGTLFVDCDILDFGKPSGVNAYAGPIVVGGLAFGGPFTARWLNPYQNVGANLTLYPNGIVNLNGHNEDFGNVTFNGGEVDTGNGQFAYYQTMTVNPTNVSAVINGYFGLPAGANRVIVVGKGLVDCDLIINAVAFGSPNYFVKQGPGTICMSGANTFNAVTLLEQGILDINNSSGLGTWPGLVIFDGATLRLSGAGHGPGFEVIGAGVGGQGAVEVVPSASWLINGGIVLDGPTTFNVGASAALGLYCPISSSNPGSSVIKTGTGNLFFGGGANNTYSGDTLVNNGGLLLEKNPNAVSVPGNLVVGPGPAGPVTFARLFQTGGLGGTTATVNGNSLLDLNGYSAAFTQLNLNDGGSVQTGAGFLDLAGGSVVSVGSQSPRGSHVSSSISGNVALPAGDVTTFSVAPYAFFSPFDSRAELEIPAAITGTISASFSGFYKTGSGRLRLSGNNSYPGAAEVNGGTLIAASATALGTTAGATYVNNTASLVLDGGITITGESVYLTSSNSFAMDSVNGANAWNGLIDLNGSINNIGVSLVGNSLSILGQVGGPGSFTKVGPGPVYLGGSAANSYGGDTFVTAGSLVLQRPAGVTQIPHNVAIGNGPGAAPATLLEQSSFSIIGSVMVNHTGLWDLTGQAEGFSFTAPPPITLNGNGSVQTGTSGIVYLPVGGDVIVNPGSNTTATISGNIGMDPGVHHFKVGSGATIPGNVDLNVNAVIGQTSTAASIQKDGAGTLRFGATNSYTGMDVVSNGVMQVDGQRLTGPARVSGGRLQGSGVVAGLSMVSSTGTVSPGDGPGILTCSNFNAGVTPAGTLLMELDGLAPGTGYDQLNVRGSVNLTGITLDARLNFASAPGNSFTIITKDGVSPITGIFNGLPQGSSLFIGGELFQIAYTGGTGNDVVLTRLVTPPKPALTAQLLPNAIVLSWPTNDPLYGLQFSTNLPTTNWTDASPPPVIVGSNFVVSNSLAGPFRVYRLKR